MKFFPLFQFHFFVLLKIKSNVSKLSHCFRESSYIGPEKSEWLLCIKVKQKRTIVISISSCNNLSSLILHLFSIYYLLQFPGFELEVKQQKLQLRSRNAQKRPSIIMDITEQSLPISLTAMAGLPTQWQFCQNHATVDKGTRACMTMTRLPWSCLDNGKLIARFTGELHDHGKSSMGPIAG